MTWYLDTAAATAALGAVSGLGVPDADVLVSTIPAVAQDRWVLSLVERTSVVFEVLYDPWPTPLVAEAQESSTPVVGGLDLLVHQAALQVVLMTGVEEAPLAAMRAAGDAALAQRRERAC